jgi:Family of unknown function (DUF6084)
MPELDFQIESAGSMPYTLAPTLAFKLRISNADREECVHSVALRCQIQIDAQRRQYNNEEKEHLLDLFGQPQRWSQTLRPMLWTHASIVVPPFTGDTVVHLAVPCTFDFNVAAAKYFAGLETGEVPLTLLFSGSVFYEAGEGGLQVTQISWEKECTYRLPISIWQEMIDAYYPNTAWLCLRRDVFDRLYKYKRERGIPTWEQALESLLLTEQETDLKIEPEILRQVEGQVA